MTVTVRASAVLLGVIAFAGAFAFFSVLDAPWNAIATLLLCGALWLVNDQMFERDPLPGRSQGLEEEQLKALHPHVATRLPPGYKIASIANTGLQAQRPNAPRLNFTFVLLINPDTDDVIGAGGVNEQAAMDNLLDLYNRTHAKESA